MSYTKVPVFNEGDLIEAVKGDTVMRGRLVENVYLGLRLDDVGWSVKALENEHFTVTVIERARPKLPTEPGSVIEATVDGRRDRYALGSPFFRGDPDVWFRTGAAAGSGYRWATSDRLSDVEVLFDAGAVSA